MMIPSTDLSISSLRLHRLRHPHWDVDIVAPAVRLVLVHKKPADKSVPSSQSPEGKAHWRTIDDGRISSLAAHLTSTIRVNSAEACSIRTVGNCNSGHGTETCDLKIFMAEQHQDGNLKTESFLRNHGENELKKGSPLQDAGEKGAEVQEGDIVLPFGGHSS